MNIRPISDLRNKFNEIEAVVNESGPLFLTKNGAGSMVVMTIDQYEQLTNKANARASMHDITIGSAPHAMLGQSTSSSQKAPNGSMPWFSLHNVPAGEMDKEYPLPAFGCGLCSASAAIFKLFGNVIQPYQLRNLLQWRVDHDQIDAFIDEDGIKYKEFLAALAFSFPIESAPVATVNDALEHLKAGHPLLTGNKGKHFKTQTGKLFSYSRCGHVICFYDLVKDAGGSIVAVKAMDSQVYGGSAVLYTLEEFSDWVESANLRTGRDAHSCYALYIREN